MTHKILKSLLPTEEHVNSFQRLCNNQIEEMRKHDVHMANVAADPENYHPYPAPMAHPDIVNSIVKDGKDYNISFEIVDDETLEDKKAKLSRDANKAAMETREKILPARKVALATIKFDKLAATEKRTPEQEKELEELMNKNKKINSVLEHYAMLESQIEDLTEKNIDKWKPAPFPEIA